MATEGLKALREGAALIDLSARGRISASGEDRKRLLHAMTTNHVQELEPGRGLYAFFLNAQGKILADALVLCRDEDLLLSLEPEAREKIYQHLDRFIIADDVTLADVTEQTCEFGLEGPKAEEWLSAQGVALPEQDYAFTSWGERIVAKASATGLPGHRLIAPAAERESLLGLLPLASADDAEIARIENGRARFGVDFTELNIAHETGLLHALHFNKGCYLGQEIVERVRSRGLVQRQLVALKIAGDTAPPAGAPVASDGADVGKITSAVYSGAQGCVRALAFVRTSHIQSGAALTVGGASAEIVEKG